MTSVTNDTTRIRRLPDEYFVDTQRMPRIDLAALLVACGAEETDPVIDVTSGPSSRSGIRRYEPPVFARLYAAARFRLPGVFAKLRVFVLIDALQRRPLNPIMF